MLTFDEAAHAYYWSGKRVPNVTGILQVLHRFDMVDPVVLAKAQQRGKDVHFACELFDLDELDEDTLAPHLQGYVEGWKKFVRESSPNWAHIEQPIYHPTFNYAGTPDREGAFTFQGCRIEDALIDIKSAEQLHPVWGLQLAAYNGARGKPHRRRFSVQVRDDGTYQIREWNAPDDWPVFVSLCTTRTWIERHKL